VPANRAAHELHVVVKVPAPLTHFQMNAQTPALQPPEAAILLLGNQMGYLAAGEHQIIPS
jgi:hypothetical protein